MTAILADDFVSWYARHLARVALNAIDAQSGPGRAYWEDHPEHEASVLDALELEVVQTVELLSRRPR